MRTCVECGRKMLDSSIYCIGCGNGQTMFTITESDLSNLLVRQKDMIIDRINSGAFAEAGAMLHVLAPLWRKVNYDYKYIELQNRLHKAMDIANP